MLEGLLEESDDTQEKFRGVLSTKEELLESLQFRFGHVYKEDNYIMATLLNTRFESSFYNTTTSELAVQRLTEACLIQPMLMNRTKIE